MSTKKEKFMMSFMKGINILWMTSVFAYIWNHSYVQNVERVRDQEMNLVFLLLFAVFYIGLAHIYDAFEICTAGVGELILSQGLAFILSDGALLLIGGLIKKQFPSMFPVLAGFTSQIAFSCLWTNLMDRVFVFQIRQKKAAFVYCDSKDGCYSDDMEEVIRSRYLSKFQTVRWICLSKGIRPAIRELEGINIVFLRKIPEHERTILLTYCLEHQIVVYQPPGIGDVLMSGARQINLSHMPMMRVDFSSPGYVYTFVKRGMDLVLSIAGMLILSPLLLLTGLGVKLQDGGNVFYRQVRLTKKGNPFWIYKFRSMCGDAEADGNVRLTTEHDSRVTPVGRWIRAVRLDELPQLFNVLKGDMSLVGPRPERPELTRQYTKDLPAFQLRMQVKAGITGYAQVYGKYNTSPHDKLQMDLLYITSPSIFHDLKILLVTLKVIFMKESTQGVKTDEKMESDEQLEADEKMELEWESERKII